MRLCLLLLVASFVAHKSLAVGYRERGNLPEVGIRSSFVVKSKHCGGNGGVGSTSRGDKKRNLEINNAVRLRTLYTLQGTHTVLTIASHDHLGKERNKKMTKDER